MIENVTDIIVARARATEGLKKTVVWSIGAHLALITIVALVDRTRTPEVPPTVMTISLSGTPGPRTGGLTPAAGRTVQAPAPVQPQRRAESAPAPKAPEMALPDPRARTRPQTRPSRAPDNATSRTPSTGERPSEGQARADTRVRGQGFGLSTGGGVGGSVQLDVTNFCCQEYLETMVSRIQSNWQQNAGLAGAATVKFTIRRDGTIEQAAVETPSGFYALDNAALRAVLVTRQLPALPAQFPNPTLTVHMRFEYQR